MSKIILLDEGDPKSLAALEQVLDKVLDRREERKNKNAQEKAHDLLTSDEAAESLRISKPKLKKLRDDGLIPFKKIGKRKIFFRKSDIEAYKKRK